ncbi:MAG: hypothetical protein E7438_02855 [Ruminococcaceae bacterium]|nr:hypothetical protein [Oscillospiraceae bacterium]
MKLQKILLIMLLLLCLSGCRTDRDPSTWGSLSSSGGSTAPTQPDVSQTRPSQTLPPASTLTTAPTLPTQPQGDFKILSYTPAVENGGVTYTGLPSLPALEYLLTDPENQRQLSTERIDHSFGAASEGEPHRITVENQKRFDEWGTGAITWDAGTEQKVLYLTFDCGYEYQNLTSAMLDVLQEKGVQATFFVTMTYLRSSPKVVARMIAEGHNVGNHSLTHPENCADLSREEMVMEALPVENHLRVNFGYSSRYFRFPSGVYSRNAVDALAGVGYRAVFWSIAYADWDPENQIGTDAAFQILTQRLHPGAVILLHTTSPDNAAILADFIDYCLSQGYRFANLDDFPG